MNYDLDTKDGLRNSVEWQSRMCDLLGEGGTWGIPATGSIYKVYKSKKLAIATKSPDTDVNRVFEAMGWKVE